MFSQEYNVFARILLPFGCFSNVQTSTVRRCPAQDLTSLFSFSSHPFSRAFTLKYLQRSGLYVMASTNMVQEYHYPLFSFHYSSVYVLFSSPISPNSNKKFARKFSSLFWWSDFTVIFTITAQHHIHGSQTELSYTSEMFFSTYSCFVTTTMSISLSAFKESVGLHT